MERKGLHFPGLYSDTFHQCYHLRMHIIQILLSYYVRTNCSLQAYSLLHYASFTPVQFHQPLMSSTRLNPARQHEDAESLSSRGWKIKLQGPVTLIALLLSTSSMESRASTLKLGNFYGKEQKDMAMVFVQELYYSKAWFRSSSFLCYFPGR